MRCAAGPAGHCGPRRPRSGHRRGSGPGRRRCPEQVVSGGSGVHVAAGVAVRDVRPVHPGTGPLAACRVTGRFVAAPLVAARPVAVRFVAARCAAARLVTARLVAAGSVAACPVVTVSRASGCRPLAEWADVPRSGAAPVAPPRRRRSRAGGCAPARRARPSGPAAGGSAGVRVRGARAAAAGAGVQGCRGEEVGNRHPAAVPSPCLPERRAAAISADIQPSSRRRCGFSSRRRPETRSGRSVTRPDVRWLAPSGRSPVPAGPW
ncbi:hypothetical protein C8E95_6883 [Pseudonocardia autotrophica]|nr:hypothetical protein C8E95_6883 [Pseudonocardia autotrophica]